MNIQKLQNEVNRRWELQANNPCHQSSDQGHALLHMTKALGKIASALNDAEHEQRPIKPDEVSKYLADIIICATRFGNNLDLEAACELRLEEKFPILD